MSFYSFPLLLGLHPILGPWCVFHIGLWCRYLPFTIPPRPTKPSKHVVFYIYMMGRWATAYTALYSPLLLFLVNFSMISLINTGNPLKRSTKFSNTSFNAD